MIKQLSLLLLAIGLAIALFGVVKGFLLLRSVRSYSQNWQERAEDTTGEIVYVALGDSTAQGIGASRPERGYVGLFADYLEAKFDEPVRVINLSKSGANLRDVIEQQLPALRDVPKADIVTIQAGANDMFTYDEAIFDTDFKTLLEGLPDGTLVSNIPNFAGGRHAKLADVSHQASLQADQLIAEAGRFKRADVYSATTNLHLSDFAIDLFHPNDRSYIKWARAFIEADKK